MRSDARSWLWRLLIVAVLACGELLSRRDMRPPPPRDSGLALVSQKALLGAVDSAMMPKFPQESLRKKVHGVVVARVTVSVEGNVTSVDVLESPDAEISGEVQGSLLKWRFDPKRLVGPTSPTAISGKITFYFTPSGPEGIVQDSATAALERTPSSRRSW